MSDVVWFWGMVAVAVSLAIWVLARVTVWLVDRHWRHCPRNPDREWNAAGVYIDSPAGVEIKGNTVWLPPEGKP